MNRIEISVLQPDAALRVFAETWHAAESGREVTPRLAFGSLRELFAAITERRLGLMRHVAAHAGLNVAQLMHSIDRDDKGVHDDVTALVELGLLERDENGALYAPYDEVLIHAGIRDAA
jgi:predicted transcriptional regulator